MDEPIEVAIEYLPDYADAHALVTPLGDRRYRLELDPLVSLTISRALRSRACTSHRARGPMGVRLQLVLE